MGKKGTLFLVVEFTGDTTGQLRTNTKNHEAWGLHHGRAALFTGIDSKSGGVVCALPPFFEPKKRISKCRQNDLCKKNPVGIKGPYHHFQWRAKDIRCCYTLFSDLAEKGTPLCSPFGGSRSQQKASS